MKKVKLVGGILLVILALVLTIMALFFPNNGMFEMFWDWGMFTFRGEASLLIFFLASGFFAISGAWLLVSHVKNRGDS